MLIKSENQSLQESDLSWLIPEERTALQYFISHLRRGGSETYPISDSVVETLFVLYLQGRTISEIRRLRPDFGLGQIVYAAAVNDWQSRRQEHLDLSVERAKVRALLAITEGVDIAADMMAALKKIHTDNISMYLMSGDLRHLNKGTGSPMQAIKQLRDITEVLMKLTGQDQKKNVSGSIEVKHSGLPTIPSKKLEIDSTVEGNVLADWAAAEKARLKKSME